MKAFERLAQSFALTVGDQLVAGAGGYSVGAIAVVFPSASSAWGAIEENREDLESLGKGELGYVEVGDPWNFMRRAAGEGLAGIQCPNPESPDAFMFMVRVEEAGSDLPTVLVESNPSGELEVGLTRTGTRRLSHAQVLHWARYDILDHVTSRWGVNCPFRHWEAGEPLYELRGDGIVVLLADVPLLGDWNSLDGAVAFFTSEDAALEFHQHHLGDGRNRMIMTKDTSIADPAEAMASLTPHRIEDLGLRLKELEQVVGMSAWCINPTGHREDSGFGRLWETGNGEPFKLRTVAGNWMVCPKNQFEKTKDALAWSGSDTLFWSGGQSIQLLPLDVSFGVDPVRDAEAQVPMSDAEMDEWVEDFLSRQVDDVTPESDPSLNSFVISCWDSVTGHVYEPIPAFDGFLAALQFLAGYERENDAQHRLEGAAACSAIGFVGSGDDGHEALRGQRFQAGLLSLAKRHLSRGYHPSYAADLVALANATLRTLHIDFAGYAKDLLWASDADTVGDLLEQLEIEPEVWDAWNDGAESVIDQRGAELAIERVGEATWSRIDLKVQQFLSTALLHFDFQGHAPQLDYAPISLEVVKGLEVELGNVLKGFRDATVGQVFEGSDREKDFAAFLYDEGKTPTLGSISYLLRKPDSDTSQLKVELHNYLESLPNGEFLTSNRFVKRDLQKVAHSYRNGGVHDSAISGIVCLKCIDHLIGTPEKPGLISKVVEWKAAI